MSRIKVKSKAMPEGLCIFAACEALLCSWVQESEVMETDIFSHTILAEGTI